MKIGIPLSNFAYTPESYAYKTYLEKFGHQVQLEAELDPNNDINFFYMGLIPFWKKTKGRAKKIHEYQSLSTHPLPKLKNYTKRTLNAKPIGRIFLNDLVRDNLNFKDDVPHLCRDMGVDEELFQRPSDNPKYDVVYCGSIVGRKGLIKVLLNIAATHKVIVIGKVSDNEKILLNCENITLVGMIERKDIPEIYREARFGLNFTPDIYPYNVQTSTKTLEYLASGLDVISNKYAWSESFFDKIDYQPVWIDSDNFLKYSNFYVSSKINKDIIKKHSWNNILSDINFEGFLQEILND